MFRFSFAGGRSPFVILIVVSLAVLGARGARADERVERAREHYVQ